MTVQNRTVSLEAIGDYLAADDPAAAARWLQRRLEKPRLAALKQTWLLVLVLTGAVGCGAAPLPAGAAAPSSVPPPLVEGMRGRRYCEVLAGGRSMLHAHLDVYDTIGLNDCPQELWAKLDRAQLKDELEVDRVFLNGPRYWLVDAFQQSRLLDPTLRTLGGIPMRKAGELDIPLLEVASFSKPYTLHEVQRDTTWVFSAGKAVYELVDARGKVYDMQSYSVQKAPLTEEGLAGLGARLKLPEGWTFRARVLTTDLRVTAVDGVATVVQDELANTYQLSQQ